MFGGYNKSLIKSGESFAWTPLTSINDNYYYWQVKIRDVIVQGQSVFSNSYSIAILESGTSLTLVPLKEMTRIGNAISKKFDQSTFACNSGSQILCLFLGKCSAVAPRLDPIKFALSGDWSFNVAPEDFLLDSTY